MVIEKTKNYCLGHIKAMSKDFYFVNYLHNGKPTPRGLGIAGKHYNPESIESAREYMLKRQGQLDRAKAKIGDFVLIHHGERAEIIEKATPDRFRLKMENGVFMWFKGYEIEEVLKQC